MATAADGTHPTGMHSCFIMVVCQKNFKVQSEFCVQSRTKNISQTTSIKLFKDQSEMSIFSVGCKTLNLILLSRYAISWVFWCTTKKYESLVSEADTDSG